jgi:hypothetical protein
MFCRVTCEIATQRKTFVDRGETEVNNGFSRGGDFTCCPTKQCNISNLFFLFLVSCDVNSVAFMIFKRSQTSESVYEYDYFYTFHSNTQKANAVFDFKLKKKK